MEILNYFLFTIMISVLIVVPGILFDTWLSKIGAVRSAKAAIIISTIVLVFLKQFIVKELSWWIYGVGMLLGVLFAVHRTDLRETMKHGKWWWKKKKGT